MCLCTVFAGASGQGGFERSCSKRIPQCAIARCRELLPLILPCLRWHLVLVRWQGLLGDHARLRHIAHGCCGTHRLNRLRHRPHGGDDTCSNSRGSLLSAALSCCCRCNGRLMRQVLTMRLRGFNSSRSQQQPPAPVSFSLARSLALALLPSLLQRLPTHFPPVSLGTPGVAGGFASGTAAVAA
jgi:hypothetical protein